MELEVLKKVDFVQRVRDLDTNKIYTFMMDDGMSYTGQIVRQSRNKIFIKICNYKRNVCYEHGLTVSQILGVYDEEEYRQSSIKVGIRKIVYNKV